MSNPIPSEISLTDIQNGTRADASVVQANYVAVETAVNGVIQALSGGTNGQYLQAADSSDVQWATPTFADKSSATEQDFTASVYAPNLLEGVATTSVAGTGSVTPLVTSSGILYVSCTASGTLTINSPGLFPASGKALVFTIIVNQAASTTLTLSWGSAYRFGSWTSTAPGGNASYAWTFLMVGNLSRAVCIGTSNGAFS